VIADYADKFSVENFQTKIKAFVESKIWMNGFNQLLSYWI
jgi:hypothetical protein